MCFVSQEIYVLNQDYKRYLSKFLPSMSHRRLLFLLSTPIRLPLTLNIISPSQYGMSHGFFQGVRDLKTSIGD